MRGQQKLLPAFIDRTSPRSRHRWSATAPLVLAACAYPAWAGSGAGSCPADLNGDGQVNGVDLGVVLFTWSTDGEGDVNGDGIVDGTDLTAVLNAWGECPPAFPELVLTLSAESLSFTEGGSTGLAGSIEVSGLGADPIVVEVSQTSTPAGLSVVNDVPLGGFVVESDGTYVFNALVSAESAGSFVLGTTATPVGGTAVSVDVTVEVLPLAGIPDLSAIGAEPAAVNPATPTNVVFSVSLTGVSVPPATFDLAQTEADGTPISSVATLRDDGAGPDATSGDGVYTGTVTVDAGEEEDARYYKATSASGVFGGSLETSIYTLDVTPFPIGPAASDPGALVDGPGGTTIYADEILVIFAPGTSDERILEILALIDGTIVGSVPATAAYQVSIPGDGTAGGVFAAIAAMKTVVDVDVAEPILPITITELVPDDPLYSDQVALRTIRANEAWTIVTGNVAIAVVDTGVDADHPDFQTAAGSKVVALPGSDLVDGDDDPADEDGHGTRMAGIAAAVGNNGIGIAGVSWQSPIIAVRAFGEGASDVTLAAGIVFAATNGARVISVSGTFDAPSAVVASAVAYAVERDCIVVAASGMQIDGQSVERYPCAFPDVLCVGAYGVDGLPLAGANLGTWVDVGAPGENLPTTALGGGYTTTTGTSGAAAMTAGALAATIGQPLGGEGGLPIDARLAGLRIRAGADRTGDGPAVGDGRLDLFESVFDGSFELYEIFPELPNLDTWSTEGTVAVVESLGPLAATDRNRMAYVSTGPAGAGIAASLRQNFLVQPGVTQFGITFDYDFLTEEWPEFVGSEFNDSLRIVLVEPDGAERLLAVESVNASEFTAIEGIDFPGGDDTVGHTGWKTVSVVVPITKGPGSYVVRIEDAGDDEYDSVVLVDRIRLVGDPAALYCGDPEAGDCCEANGTPYCDDIACCDIVCTIDPVCCLASWDGLCAELAAKFCDLCGAPTEICDNGIDDDGDGLVDCDDPDCAADPDCDTGGFCGDPNSGDCCEDNGTPFCDDAECCGTVCATDPFCCESAWDSICAESAAKLCSICGGGLQEVCDNGVDDDGDGLVDCEDSDCARFPGCCPDGLADCNGVCVDLSSDIQNCGECGVVCDDGDPCTVDSCVNGECLHELLDEDGDGYAPTSCGGDDCDDNDPNVNPGASEICDNGVDDDCDGLVDCEDADCANAPECGGTGVCGDPAAGDCCEANGTPYCSDESCCSAVCAVDPFCCETSWDSICVEAAGKICDPCAPPQEICDNGTDDDGDGLVDCEDPDCGESPACCDGEPATFEMGDLILSGGEISTLGFAAVGAPSEVAITFTFSGDGVSWASDLVLVIDDGTNPPVYWGGFDQTFNGVVFGGTWPFDGAGSAEDGFYAGTVSVPVDGLLLDGSFTIGIGNGWGASGPVAYDGIKVTLDGICPVP